MNIADKEREREAHVFALMLLMPEQLLKEELIKIKFDLTAKGAVRSLAEKFEVSENALLTRLMLMNSGTKQKLLLGGLGN